MKFVAFFCLFVVAASKHIQLNSELNEHWENFKKAFGKVYDGSEETIKRSNWEQSVTKIVQHNLKYDLGLHSYRMGINEYSDMDHNEFEGYFLGSRMQPGLKTNSSNWIPVGDIQLPSHVDWRRKGLVTPVKNQKICNSCWTFAATGALEGQHKKKTGRLVSLSEQNLVDCSVSHGCNPGFVSKAYDYINNNHGIDTEASYPYTGREGNCHFRRSSIGATLKGYVELPIGDEEVLKQAVATVGPIAAMVDAGHNFKHYQDGIYNEPYCGIPNHCILIVGYGHEDGQDYWLVKNSWGKSFGNKGYIKLSRNKNNQCGIASQSFFPIV